jgi:hypothetical protein
MKSVLFSAVLVAVAAAAACGKGATEVEVVAGAPAGDVTEVAGAVTATRAGQTRALKVGDAISGDDVIATNAEGRVTITLRHNHVPWSLGPGKSKRVADSAAWRASEGANVAEVTDDKSGAAGRHAERNGADTAATAAEPAPPTAQAAMAPAAPSAPAPGAPAPVAAAPAPGGPPPPVEVAATRDDADDPRDKAPPKGNRREADLVDALADTGEGAPDGLGMTGTGQGGGGQGEGISLGSIGTIGRGGGGRTGAVQLGTATGAGAKAAQIAAARRTLASRTGVLRACYQQQLQGHPDLTGKIVFAIDIDAAGAVTAVTAQGAAPMAQVSECARAQIARLTFPVPPQPWALTIALTFK